MRVLCDEKGDPERINGEDYVFIAAGITTTRVKGLGVCFDIGYLTMLVLMGLGVLLGWITAWIAAHYWWIQKLKELP
jgi:hypothetical protein